MDGTDRLPVWGGGGGGVCAGEPPLVDDVISTYRAKGVAC